jgi:hypothetical protein
MYFGTAGWPVWQVWWLGVVAFAVAGAVLAYG